MYQMTKQELLTVDLARRMLEYGTSEMRSIAVTMLREVVWNVQERAAEHVTLTNTNI